MIDFHATEQQEIASITALNLAAYLRKTGWQYQGKRGRNAHIYTIATQQRRNTVAVPVFEPLDDHAERITDAIQIICQAENRPPSAVFLDLAKADNDSVRIASTNGAGHSPLTISNSAGLLEAAHDLMFYSARAAEDARSRNFRAAFRGGASAQVSSFLNNLTFSPDFLRGYRLTMYSPVPVRLEDSSAHTPDTDETPFAREATQTLAQALSATSEAVSIAVESQSSGHFRNAIEKGVTANLCDALSRLAKGGKEFLSKSTGLCCASPARPPIRSQLPISMPTSSVRQRTPSVHRIPLVRSSYPPMLSNWHAGQRNSTAEQPCSCFEMGGTSGCPQTSIKTITPRSLTHSKVKHHFP